jgi:hypothetical protein
MGWERYVKVGDKNIAKNIPRNFDGLRNNHVYTVASIYDSDGKTYVALEEVCFGEELPGWFPERFSPILNTALAEMEEEA